MTYTVSGAALNSAQSINVMLVFQCLTLFDTIAAWWQPAVSKSGILLSSLRREAPLKLEGKAAHATVTVPDLFWQHGASMLSPVRNIVLLQYFDTVDWVTGRASGLYLLQNPLFPKGELANQSFTGK